MSLHFLNHSLVTYRTPPLSTHAYPPTSVISTRRPPGNTLLSALSVTSCVVAHGRRGAQQTSVIARGVTGAATFCPAAALTFDPALDAARG